MVETLLLLTAAVVGAIMLCAVAAVSSLLSGWGRLAERYRAPEQPEVTRFGRWRSRVSGPYLLLTIGAGRSGLHLASPAWFRLFHPPLLIPWSDIRAERLHESLVFAYRLRFRGLDGIYLDLRRAAFEPVIDFARRELQEEVSFASG
jgi:hypothetical protein